MFRALRKRRDMGIILKNREEIAKMRVAGQLAADVLRMIRPHVQPGVTTGELDDICHEYITGRQEAIPAPLNYRGFPSPSALRSITSSVTAYPVKSASKTGISSISTSP